MFNKKHIKYFIVFNFLFLNQYLSSQTDLTADKIFESLNNSVVVILAYDKDTNLNQGSGVLINSKGDIATNFHVCSDAERIEVKHYNKTYTNVEIVFKDEIEDILILRISENELKPVKVGTSKDLKPGQRVYAIGSPEGYENSISDGIISGFRYDENNMGLIQMTTPITEGSSGGAVVNSRGELIGLSMSGQHEGNIYFAIPIDVILDALKSNKVIANVNENLNYLQEGDKANKKSDFEDAVFYFSKYLEKNRDDAEAYSSRAYANMKLKRFKQAITDYTNAIKYQKDSFELFFYRGNCNYSIHNFEDAVSDYTQAINLSPQYSELYYNRGYAFLKLKNYTECLKDWQTSIEYNLDYESELNPLIIKIKDYLKDNQE